MSETGADNKGTGAKAKEVGKGKESKRKKCEGVKV